MLRIDTRCGVYEFRHFYEETENHGFARVHGVCVAVDVDAQLRYDADNFVHTALQAQAQTAALHVFGSVVTHGR